jgi:RNA polymerase sigma-70 factor (ECF subfamily)
MTPSELQSAIDRILGGEIDAYESVVRAYQPEVWKVVCAMLFDQQRAEDLVQQTFINAYRHLNSYRRGQDFGVWVKEIARNVVRQELRRQSREDRRLQLYRTRMTQTFDGASAFRPQEELEEALRDCTKNLAPSSAQVVELRYQAGLSFGEVAARIGRTVEATRQHLARIRLNLKECIEKNLTQT